MSPDAFGDMAASALNCRFMSFLLELSKKLGIHANEIFSAGESILEDAEISQDGFIDDIVRMDKAISYMEAKLAVMRRFPCHFNSANLEGSVEDVVKLWKVIREGEA